MRELSYLYRNIMVGSLMTDQFFQRKDLTVNSFYVLLSIYMVAESEITGTVSNTMVKGFMRNYLKGITDAKYLKIVDDLHESGYIWLGTLKKVTITKIGKKVIIGIYNHLYEFEKASLHPVVKVMTSGKLSGKGLLKAHQNLRSRRVSNPYMGVQKHPPSGKWYAYLKSNGKEISLGLHKKPMNAAKARDRYILENKLGNQLSIKIKKP